LVYFTPPLFVGILLLVLASPAPNAEF
jgi:hypothetical protein